MRKSLLSILILAFPINLIGGNVNNLNRGVIFIDDPYIKHIGSFDCNYRTSAKHGDMMSESEYSDARPRFDPKFNQAVMFVLKHEGGLVDNPKDPGGATDYGISLRYLREDKLDLNHDHKITDADIKSLTREEAMSIYREEWWDRYRYYELSSTLMATKIFDLSVNVGATEAHKLAQRACNYISSSGNSCEKLLLIDGQIGPDSYKALNQLYRRGKEPEFLQELIHEASMHYTNITKENPNLSMFLKGWLNRAKDMP